MELGTLAPAADRWQLRFNIPFAHAQHDVWTALTKADQLGAWFPDGISGDIEPGAQLRFDLSAHNLPDMTGHVLRFDAEDALELTWGDDTLLFELSADAAGITLTMTVTFDELGKAARDGAGWHECLTHLGHLLDGTPKPRPGEIWKTVHPLYEAALGPEASTIGPPEGWDPDSA